MAVVEVERVGVVADSVLVVEVAAVLEVAVAAFAVTALVVEVVVSVVAAGPLTLAVLLVICVRVFERLLAMLDAPPEPQPATRTATTPASAILSIGRADELIRIVVTNCG